MNAKKWPNKYQVQGMKHLLFLYTARLCLKTDRHACIHSMQAYISVKKTYTDPYMDKRSSTCIMHMNNVSTDWN